MTVLLVVGARPNYMKIAPLYHAMKKCGAFTPLIVHTGQHYDSNMSDVFFEELGLPRPDYFLAVGSGTHAEQTGKAMMAFEKVCLEKSPSWVVVVGDVNSTLAAALVASKLQIKLAHVEAGLRSFDRSMPEEINRVIVDALSDLLFVHSAEAIENLRKEGIVGKRVVFPGNIMIDAFEMMRPKITGSDALSRFGKKEKEYFLLTIHRPSNINDSRFFERLFSIIDDFSSIIGCIFPMHPNTRKKLYEYGLWDRLAGINGVTATEPLSYTDFMCLALNSRFVVTDSGGVQEETTYAGLPCVTLRPNTERIITVTEGTNELSTLERLPGHIRTILSGGWKKGRVPELWDGRTASRVLKVIMSYEGTS